jgi:hypothetical protein
MVAIIFSPTVYICIICRYESALIAAIRHESALIRAIIERAPAKMIDVMIENYPEEINSGDQDGMYFTFTS